MARKLPKLERVLDAPALFSVAYGEIASSIYFALGVVALYALGVTPLVLLAAGLIFFVVSLSYAEGTTMIRETGGAASFVRIAFNDFAGFLTGWVLFLDYLIVIAISALFIPHYLGAAIGVEWMREEPWDSFLGLGAMALVAAFRLARRARLYTFAVAVALVDLAPLVALVGLGFALLFSPGALTSELDLGSSPEWHELAYALPLAFLAYTGLETVANLAEETRRPGRALPRSLFSAIAVVVALSVAIAVVGLSAFPARDGATALGDEWLRAPLMGIVDAVSAEVPGWLGSPLRVYVGLTGVLILLTAMTTSISGSARLAYSLGEHGQLPRVFGRLHRRTLVAPQSIVAAVVVSGGLLMLATFISYDTVVTLASLFSFGVLLAFSAAQLAVVRLRVTRPELRRPFRVPGTVRIRGRELPALALVGLAATLAAWLVAFVTHPGARVIGPPWLALGLLVYWAVRRSHGEGLLERVVSTDEQTLPEVRFSRILVPMKFGPIGEEMVMTAIRIAEESTATVEVVSVIAVPLDRPLDAQLLDLEARAGASLAEARVLGREHGVVVETHLLRARAIGAAIVEHAASSGADLIVLGSSPRWRRQSRFFSPTVDYVLKRAPCEVLIVAFPQGVLDEESAPVPA